MSGLKRHDESVICAAHAPVLVRRREWKLLLLLLLLLLLAAALPQPRPNLCPLRVLLQFPMSPPVPGRWIRRTH